MDRQTPVQLLILAVPVVLVILLLPILGAWLGTPMNDAIQGIISAFIIPILLTISIIIVLWVFRYQIRGIVQTTGLSEVGFSPDGVISIKLDPVKFAGATYAKQKMDDPSPEDVQQINNILQALKLVSNNRRILWVDNHPESNLLERKALISWGVDVQTRRNTDDAIADMKYQLVNNAEPPFDLVISDWFRGRNPEGKILAQKMRSEGIDIPIVFYFLAGDEQIFKSVKDDASSLGAMGATSSPRELLEWIFRVFVQRWSDEITK